MILVYKFLSLFNFGPYNLIKKNTFDWVLKLLNYFYFGS